MKRGALRLVAGLEEAERSIFRFEPEADHHTDLRARATMVHEWYAVREGRTWRFAPSKWAGYRDVNAASYLAGSGKRGVLAGGQTETVLRTWFAPVDPSSVLGGELREILVQRLAAWGKRPRNPIGINIPLTEIEKYRGERGLQALDEAIAARVVIDREICGGRPFIRGTRVRVQDIVEMLASGIDRAEILADYPYLADSDISAALAYAARATSHRVVRAA